MCLTLHGRPGLQGCRAREARWRLLAILLACLIAGCAGRWSAARFGPSPGLRLEQRNAVSYLRGPYNFDFWRRHNEAYRFGAAIHFAHGKAHDVPQLTPLDRAAYLDHQLDSEMVHWIYDLPRLEPHMEYWGPHTGQFAWDLYRAIDWTHMHHVRRALFPGDPVEREEALDRPLRRLLPVLARHSALPRAPPRSPAPLDVTMRRAGVMMKPYFAYFRTYYPESAKFFYVAHWWHPVIYEAMMIAGNDDEQDQAVQTTHHRVYEEVIHDRPLRMLLSRESMPRYSRMSPESANIFDNLHMLHGIAYSILSCPGYTEQEKREELYRVIDAMRSQPGDRELARLFPIPVPEMDPRIYAGWMKSVRSPGLGMNEIMAEMLREMWPKMSGDGSGEPPPVVWEQFWKKMEPGMQPGERPGSLHDALRAVHPALTMDPQSMQAGVAPKPMIEAMLAGWREKHAGMDPVPPLPMEVEPDLPAGAGTAADGLSARGPSARGGGAARREAELRGILPILVFVVAAAAAQADPLNLESGLPLEGLQVQF